jgi:hypothetical protein
MLSFHRLASARVDDPLKKLPYAEHATFNHYSPGTESLCLPNTRVQVLQEIMAWASGETGRGAIGSGSGAIVCGRVACSSGSKSR